MLNFEKLYTHIKHLYIHLAHYCCCCSPLSLARSPARTVLFADYADCVTLPRVLNFTGNSELENMGAWSKI
jgi:hypothetical protein